MGKASGKVTPLMKQYQKVKATYPDAILLFRVGDFYETFGADAVNASNILGIVLTARNNGGSNIELAGFPYHSLDTYLPKLVKAGYRVAICEQLEKPSKEKKIVKRGVTEMVTPGLTTDVNLLEQKSNNFLASVHFGKKDLVGIAFVDISTGEFYTFEGSASNVQNLIQSYKPAEIVYSRKHESMFKEKFSFRGYTFLLDDWIFSKDYGRDQLLEHFKTSSLKGFGIEEFEAAQISAGAILHYLSSTENKNNAHLSTLSRIHLDQFVWMDHFTMRNLELLYSNNGDGVSLLKVMDSTSTPMGGRLLKKWVALPLLSKTTIDERLAVVDHFVKDTDLYESILPVLKKIGDLERLISKVTLGKINPREIAQLKASLDHIPVLKEMLEKSKQTKLEAFGDSLNSCTKLVEKIGKELTENPPINLQKGAVIADGVSAELDEYRNIINNSHQILAEIQQREAKATGIEKLKIGFNNVFGYYLEVTNRYRDKGLVPENWVRKQTLTSCERYITEELKVLEAKILSAEEKIMGLEQQLYDQLVAFIANFVKTIQSNAYVLAQLDCLLAFAYNAKRFKYCKPAITEDTKLEIENGRHPVIEQFLPADQPYVPNDVMLDSGDQQIMMLTGPNMAGKSALLRQTALIALMAQMGSFVPASAATIGLVDKVFTRVGASDNISSGESTFMVEMNETATIMNNISNRSLILLDEIGRGTSTYDGISIAWAIAEFLHTNPMAHPKTLFATHYHELNELSNRFERIHNFHIATKEIGKKVIFLRKLTPGGSSHSFGIYVAQMAGMPKTILERAELVLESLQSKTIEKEVGNDLKERVQKIPDTPIQLSLFEITNPATKKVLESIKSLEMDGMTPIDCLIKLNEFKKLLDEA